MCKFAVVSGELKTENGAGKGAQKGLGAGSRRPPFNEARSAANVSVPVTAPRKISRF